MSILPLLLENKGTVSSRLGKELAARALDGETAIVAEAASLLAHDSKSVRAGAAKILEQVALSRPHLVAPHSTDLLRALDMPEPQTRWMCIHALGLCADIAPSAAREALPKAREFVTADSGACLWNATVTYLGDLGALSPHDAALALPLLSDVLQRMPKLSRVTLEALVKLAPNASDSARQQMGETASRLAGSKSTAIARAARKLAKALA